MTKYIEAKLKRF